MGKNKYSSDMEQEIENILLNSSLTDGEVSRLTNELLNLFSVRVRCGLFKILKIKNMNTNRKEGFYKVKFKGEWRKARWVINADIDSSWCCWWIEGEKPKLWGWSDDDFDDIVESSWSGNTER